LKAKENVARGSCLRSKPPTVSKWELGGATPGVYKIIAPEEVLEITADTAP